MSDEEVLSQFKNRFKNTLPLDNIDCVLVCSLEDPVEKINEEVTDERAETDLGKTTSQMNLT